MSQQLRQAARRFGEREFLEPGESRLRDELRRELAAPAEAVVPRLVDDLLLVAVEAFHFAFLVLRLSEGACFITPDSTA